MKTKIKNTNEMGRGLFATKEMRKGEIVEVSPVILIPEVEARHAIGKTILTSYVFRWNEEYTALALGHGSLFNHDFEANVTYASNFSGKSIVFKTTRKVKKGEQLFINYGYQPEYAKRILNNIVKEYSKPMPVAIDAKTPVGDFDKELKATVSKKKRRKK